MRTHTKLVGAMVALGLALCCGSANAALIDLGAILANSGYENDLTHSQWVATLPNANYSLTSPVVNETLIPYGSATPITAPVGDNFVGVRNNGDNDINGKLVHNAISYDGSVGDQFFVTVYANRAREDGATSGDWDPASSASTLSVTFDAWGAGSSPTVNPNTDDWSRNPAFHQTSAYSNYGVNGEWTSQTFLFTLTQDIDYLSLSITGQNHKHDSWVAWDIGDPQNVVPEPASIFLMAGGLGALALKRRRKV